MLPLDSQANAFDELWHITRSLALFLLHVFADKFISIMFSFVIQEYRDRVLSALSQYHGIPPGTERKPRRRPSDNSQSPRRSPAKKKVSEEIKPSKSDMKIKTPRPKRKRIAPLYKDPLASSKLEMIKNIRAQRATAETKKIEAIERAR